jgi:hypothetical protein
VKRLFFLHAIPLDKCETCWYSYYYLRDSIQEILS